MDDKPGQQMHTTTPSQDAAAHCACIVCAADSAHVFATIDARRYWRCPVCQATFLDPKHRLGATEEHAHYRTHRNDPADPDYRRFLANLADPLRQRLPPASQGLDYGCGPGPALACMLREAGHRVAVYDPLFHPDPAPLSATYDFITCTETAEHFHQPWAEFDRLNRMLRPGGWLGLMTCFQTDDTRFARWYYRRDPTHVVFYRAATLRLIARRLGWRCAIPASNIALLHKPDTATKESCHAR